MIKSRNAQKNSPDSKNGFRPFDFIGNFFHPCSRNDLNDSIKKSTEASTSIAQTLSETKKLHEQIDLSLAAVK